MELKLSLNKWRNAQQEWRQISDFPLCWFVSILTVDMTASCVGSTKDLTNTPIKYKRTRQREEKREEQRERLITR